MPGGKILGNSWYFTSAENWGHFIAGALLLTGWYFGSPWLWRKLIIATMLAAFYFVLTGFLVRDLMPLNYYNIANFEYPWDELPHAVFVVWPLWALWQEKKRPVVMQ